MKQIALGSSFSACNADFSLQSLMETGFADLLLFKLAGAKFRVQHEEQMYCLIKFNNLVKFLKSSFIIAGITVYQTYKGFIRISWPQELFRCLVCKKAYRDNSI